MFASATSGTNIDYVFDDASPYSDPGFQTWQLQLRNLRLEAPRVRTAMPTAQDGQTMRWLQMSSESMYIHSVSDNTSTIEKKLVLLAEIANCPVGLCIAAVGRYAPDFLFIQRVAVDPLARRRGAGLALLKAAAQEEPSKRIAGASLDDDRATHALNQKLAAFLGSSVRTTTRRRFARTDLSMAEGENHRPWFIDRSRPV